MMAQIYNSPWSLEDVRSGEESWQQWLNSQTGQTQPFGYGEPLPSGIYERYGSRYAPSEAPYYSAFASDQAEEDARLLEMWNQTSGASLEDRVSQFAAKGPGSAGVARLIQTGVVPAEAQNTGPMIAYQQHLEAKAGDTGITGFDIARAATLAAMGYGAGAALSAGTAAGGAAAEGAGAAGAGATAEGAGFTGGFTGTAAGAPGFTGAAAGSPGLAATLGATGTSLAPGFFAGESLLPAIGGLGAATGAAGLGAASSGASGGAGGAAGGALVDGVMTDGATSGDAAGVGAGTALSRLLGGGQNTADWLNLLGIAGATGLGIYGSKQQSDALRDIAREQGVRDDARYADLTRRESERYTDVVAREQARYGDIVSRDAARFGDLKAREDAALGRQSADIDFARGVGAPARGRYEATFAPGFDVASLPGLQSAMDTSYDTLLRRLSTGGNPFGNPGGLAEAMKYVTGNVALPALSDYRSSNLQAGGFPSYGSAGSTVRGTGTSLSPGVAGTGSIFPGNAGAGAGVGTQGGLQAQLGAVNAQGDIYNSLGYGLGQLTQPRRRSLADYLGSLT